MDPLQFSLFFIALLVGYVLVHLRMVRFERYLRHMEGLAGLRERVDQLGKEFGRLDLSEIQDGVQVLHEDLERVQQGLSRLERVTARGAEERIVTMPVPDVPPPGGEDQLTSAVLQRLRLLGYQDPVLVTDPSSVAHEEQAELIVECVRGGMLCKGRVTVQDGSVVDLELRPVSQGFP